jgi:acyl-CoA synthetase (AMP-forming)/AMP-acid ligase II
MNIADLLINSANKYPEKTAILSEERRLSYKRFNLRVNQIAQAMREHGLKKVGRVALMFYNTHHFAEVYFATAKAGAVATPVNFRFVGEEIEYIINNSEASFFFFGSEFRDTIADIHKKLRTVRNFVGVDATKGDFAYDYDSFLSSGKTDELDTKTTEKDPCQIMYTSGTTGRPKGAVLTHGNIFWNLMNTIYAREHRHGEISLIIGPLYHTAALNNHFTTQIALGGTSILIKKFDPEVALNHIKQEKANVISGSPSMFNLLIQYPKFDQFDTHSITKCTTGASILPQEIKEQLIDSFPNAQGIYDLYGCTEASPTITTLNARDSLKKHGSVGLPAPFLQVRIVDEEGQTLGPNHVAELACKGPNVMRGYYKDDLGTEEVIRDGWLYTGDLARVDENGYFYIVDRKKDMIVSGGENVYPREIEEVLFRHPMIADAAVVGIPHSTWGETVKAFVVPKERETLKEEEIVEFCTAHLASFKKPTSVEFVSSLPKNPSGKTLKRLLRNGGTMGENI